MTKPGYATYDCRSVKMFVGGVEIKPTPLAKYSWVVVHDVTPHHPTPATPTPALSRECPCGIFRGDCEYHR